MKRVYGLLFVAYGCTCFGFPLSSPTHTSSFGMIYMDFLLQCLWIGLLFLIYYNTVLFFGHLAQSIYYFISEKGVSPVLFYPFIFFNGSKKITLFTNFLYMAEPFYPSKLFENTKAEYHEKEILKLCKAGHYCMVVSQILFCIICMVIFIINLKFLIAFACGVMVFVCLSLAVVKTPNYHGVLAHNKYMNEGYASVYFARQLILYTNEYHPIYNKIETMLEKDIDKNMLLIVIQSIQYMYMIKCMNKDFFISTTIEKYTEENLFLHSVREFSNMHIGDNKFSVMKVYLYNAMINNDINKQNLIVSFFENLANDAGRLAIEVGRYNSGFESSINWYTNIGREHKINPQYGIIKQKMMRNNNMYLTFNNYRSNNNTIINKIKDICYN